jgi:hypothetical protein
MRSAGAQRRRTAVLALALAALAVGGGAEVLASAQVHPRMTIKVSRQVEKDTFKGRIKAKDRACSRARKVKLVVRKPSTEKSRVGSAKTNRKGRWKFVPPPGGDGAGYYADEGTRYAEPGEYRAKVREQRIRGVLCAAGKTSPIHVG